MTLHYPINELPVSIYHYKCPCCGRRPTIIYSPEEQLVRFVCEQESCAVHQVTLRLKSGWRHGCTVAHSVRETIP